MYQFLTPNCLLFLEYY